MEFDLDFAAAHAAATRFSTAARGFVMPPPFGLMRNGNSCHRYIRR
jgi:hypothetical protein